MSLLPYFFDYELPHLPRRRPLDQNFGLALTPDDLLVAPINPLISRFRPFWQRDGSGINQISKDKWQINVDVKHFSPEEVTVKIADGSVIIEGKHEEKRDDHGFISRQFVRKFQLPDGVNCDLVESRLSSDGVLTVLAPTKGLPGVEGKDEKAVPITYTGPVRREVIEPKTEEKKEIIC